MTIAFTGGGTGGHIYPGLAVAAEIKKRSPNLRLIWIGSDSEMDRSIVKEAVYPAGNLLINEFFSIPSGKLRRYFSLKNFTDIFKIIAGFFSARKILKKQKACLLFSKGGFVSVPPCAAAASLKIPVFTHESDYSPGLATRLNAPYVKNTGGMIFTAYDDTCRFFKEKYRNFIAICGQPVRSSFYNSNPAKGREFLKVEENTRILLILGGSQGAQEVNDMVRAVLDELTRMYTVVHQVGSNNECEIPAGTVIENYKPFKYIKDEMPDVMAAAEIVMGRSGAGIWEWAASGKPMILIPLAGKGTRGDQIENAQYFENKGAAIVIKNNDLTLAAKELLNTVEYLFKNTEKREAMALASLKNAAYLSSNLIAENLFSKLKETGVLL